MTSTKKNKEKYLGFIHGWMIIFLLIIHACQPIENEEPLHITTDAVSKISEDSYSISGTLASIGTEEITQHGICSGELPLPELEGQAIQLGPVETTGSFSVVVSGLDANKTYHTRAFVVSNSVPIYANEKTFITEPDVENRLIDINGNIYRTVEIGEQTWMAENLKATKYADGTPIPHVESHAEWFDFNRESMGYCWYDNLIALGYGNGALYSWPAITRRSDPSDLNPSGTQGVCPEGWHLPSDSEWKELEINLGMSEEDLDKIGWRGIEEGGKLKHAGTQSWQSPNLGATSETGFDALPGGYRHGSAEYIGIRSTARFWTASKNGYSYGWYRRLDFDHSSINRNFTGVYSGLSVRCLKDE